MMNRRDADLSTFVDDDDDLPTVSRYPPKPALLWSPPKPAPEHPFDLPVYSPAASTSTPRPTPSVDPSLPPQNGGVELARCSQCRHELPASRFPIRIASLTPYQICKGHEWYWTEEKKLSHWAPEEVVEIGTVCSDVVDRLMGRGNVEAWVVEGGEEDRGAIVERVAMVGDWISKPLALRKSRAVSFPLPPPTYTYIFHPPKSSLLAASTSAKLEGDAGTEKLRLTVTFHASLSKYVLILREDSPLREGKAWKQAEPKKKIKRRSDFKGKDKVDGSEAKEPKAPKEKAIKVPKDKVVKPPKEKVPKVPKEKKKKRTLDAGDGEAGKENPVKKSRKKISQSEVGDEEDSIQVLDETPVEDPVPATVETAAFEALRTAPKRAQLLPLDTLAIISVIEGKLLQQQSHGLASPPPGDLLVDEQLEPQSQAAPQASAATTRDQNHSTPADAAFDALFLAASPFSLAPLRSTSNLASTPTFPVPSITRSTTPPQQPRFPTRTSHIFPTHTILPPPLLPPRPLPAFASTSHLPIHDPSRPLSLADLLASPFLGSPPLPPRVQRRSVQDLDELEESEESDDEEMEEMEEEEEEELMEEELMEEDDEEMEEEEEEDSGEEEGESDWLQEFVKGQLIGGFQEGTQEEVDELESVGSEERY